MVTVTKVQMKCEDCGRKFDATKTQGGFLNKLSYSPNHCPVCGSKNVREHSGIVDAIGSLFGF
jgi:Zn finger protein HypA/HybF involved in hydrogenase expression